MLFPIKGDEDASKAHGNGTIDGIAATQTVLCCDFGGQPRQGSIQRHEHEVRQPSKRRRKPPGQFGIATPAGHRGRYLWHEESGPDDRHALGL